MKKLKIKVHSDKIFAYVAMFSMVANILSPFAALIPATAYAEEAPVEETTQQVEEESSVPEEEAPEEEVPAEEQSTEETSTEETQEPIQEETTQPEAVEEPLPADTFTVTETEEPVITEEQPGDILPDGASDYRPEAEVEGSEATEVQEIVDPVATEPSGTEPEVIIEPVIPVEETPVEVVKEYETLEDGVEIKDSVEEDWKIDEEKPELRETKELVKVGIKYIFPLDEDVSITFTKLPKLDEDRSTLKIERVKVSDLNLPDDFKTDVEYAFDITTDMEDGEFEYSLTLPKPKGADAGVVYTEKTISEIESEGLGKDDVKEIDSNKIDQNDDSVKIENLDHFTTYIVKTYASDLTTEKTAYLQGETVYAKGTKPSSDDIRLIFKNPSDVIVKTCDPVNGTVTTCSFDLPSDAPLGEWDVELQEKNGSWQTKKTASFYVTLNWPTSWTTPNSCVTDPTGEPGVSPDEVDLTGNSGTPAVGFASDSNYQYFRERVDGNPGTAGDLDGYSWVVLFQTNAPTYQYLASVTGKNTTELGGKNFVSLWLNSPETDPVDFYPLFGDTADTVLWSGPSAGYARVVDAGGGKYYVDWAIPLSELTSRGITVSTTKYFATSANANNYNKDHLLCYEAMADLSIVKTDNPDPVTSGGILTYTLAIHNAGPDTASGVVVTDTLPAGYSVTSVTPSQGSCSDMTDPDIQCELGSMANGADATITIVGTIVGSGTVTNNTSVTLDTTVSIDTNQSNNSNFENTTINQPTGTITIIKDSQPDDGQDFSFTTTGGLSPSSFSLDDDSDPTLSNTQVFSNLAVGTYSVSEGTVTGWTQASATCTDGSPVSAISLSAGENITCTFTNTKRGHIIVDKVTNPSDSSQSFNFTVTGSGYSNFSLTGLATPNDQEVVPGAYSVTETPESGWDLSVVCSDGSSNTAIDISTGENVTCTFTNTMRGAIGGHKYNDADGNITTTGDRTGITGWTIFIDADGDGVLDPGESSTTTASNGTYGFGSLTPGTYKIGEVLQNGWVRLYPPLSGDDYITVTLDPGENDFSNNFINTQLTFVTVFKDVDSDGDGDIDISHATDWTWDINGAGNYATGSVISNFHPGTYIFSEDQQSGYHVTSLICNNGITNPNQNYGAVESQSIPVSSGQNLICTFTNTQDTGTLIVKKVVVNDNGGTLDYEDFSFSVNDGTATAFEADGQNDLTVNAGTYSVTEPAAAGYATTYDNCTDVVISNGGSATCTITNDDIAPTLTLVKTVVNDNGGDAVVADDFQAYIDDEPIDWDQAQTLAVGDYVVSEDELEGYSASVWSGDCDDQGNVSLAEGENKTCYITNDDIQPQFQLVKEVVGGNAQVSDFNLFINGIPVVSGETNSFDAGDYTITETGPDGYTASFSGDCDENGNFGLVVGNPPRTCTITNTRDTGNIQVQKIVDYGSVTDWFFSLDGGIVIQAGANGIVDFGQVITLDTHTIVETGPLGTFYLGSVSGTNCTPDLLNYSASATVTKDGTTICTFSNSVNKGSITIIKDAIPDDPEDFSFTAQGNGVSGFSLDDDSDPTLGNTQTFSNLFPGAYTISETPVTGWDLSLVFCDSTDENDTLTISSALINLSAGENVTCTFTNTKRGSITIVKNTVGGDGLFNFDSGTLPVPGFSITTSGNTGNESFNNLLPGTYDVYESYVPSDWDLTDLNCVDSDGGSSVDLALGLVTIDLDPGQSITCTFTNTKRGTISGYKYKADGSTGIIGWAINLYSCITSGTNCNTFVATTSTGAGGAFSFTNLITGFYQVLEDLTNLTYTPVSVTSHNVTVAPGSTNTGNNFSNFKNISISGIKYNDLNGDGTLDAGEPGLPNWTINLYKYENNLPVLVTLTTTDSNGNFSFTNLSPTADGIYKLAEVNQAGWQQTEPVDFYHVAVADGQNAEGYRFGNYQPGTITIIKDADPNGSQDFSFTTTGSDLSSFDLDDDSDPTLPNNWQFAAVPGVYVVSENQVAGWDLTDITCIGGVGDTATDVATRSAEIHVLPGENITCTFTNTKIPTLTVTKIIDPSNDQGLFNLFIDSNGVATDVGHNFTSNLLQVDIGFLHQVSETAGTGTNLDDYTATYEGDCNAQGQITLSAGENKNCTIINTLKLGSIFGIKFEDKNSNHVQDGDEGGLSGWTIYIDSNKNNQLDGGEPTQVTDSLGNFTFSNLLPGNYWVKEVNQAGWSQTRPTWPYQEVDLTAGENEFIYFGNVLISAELYISKENDTGGNSRKVGDLVTFIIRLRGLGSNLKNVKVIDLLPKGFSFVTGSSNWSVNSNIHEPLSITEPNYVSPGTWDIGNMDKDEEITITYKAEIEPEVDPGLYKDLAMTMGEDILDRNVLGLSENPGEVSTYFVGTEVEVVKEESTKDTVDVEETEEEEGEVLGASTELPATGASTTLVKILLLVGFTGGLLLIIGGLGTMLKKRKILALILLAFGMSLFGTRTTYAKTVDIPPEVRIEDPKSPATGPFGVTFVVMDVLDRDMDAECYVEKPGEASFSMFGSVIDVTIGGNTYVCDVTDLILGVNGTYKFMVKVTPDGGSTVESAEVSVDYDGTSPDRPKYIEKDKKSDCKYEIKLKTDDDGETAYVKIYRDDDMEMNLHDGNLVKTKTIGPDETYEFTDELYGSDCGKTWYYAVIAFDSAGNASDPRAEEVVTKVTITTTTTEEEVLGALEIPGGAGLGGEVEAGVGGETTGETGAGGGSVLGEETQGFGFLLKMFKSPWFWIPLLIIAYIIVRVIKNKKKKK